MASEAYDVITALVTLLDANKSVVKTVTAVYQSLDVLEREARETPSNFPKAIVVFGVDEVPQSERTIGSTIQMLLPVAIDIYVPEVTDVQLERENAVQEIRDIIENTVNAFLTANNHRIISPLKSVQRLVTYESDSTEELIMGLASISFDVDYRYTKGAS